MFSEPRRPSSRFRDIHDAEYTDAHRKPIRLSRLNTSASVRAQKFCFALLRRRYLPLIIPFIDLIVRAVVAAAEAREKAAAAVLRQQVRAARAKARVAAVR